MNKQQKTIQKLIAIALILAAIYLFAGIAKQVYVTLQLRQEKKIVEEELVKLKVENERLLANKKKFEDPNYIVTYAHGAYMFSKEDEKVFYLPSTNNDDKSSPNTSEPPKEETPAPVEEKKEEPISEETPTVEESASSEENSEKTEQ